jgi:pimeloyl-ACP methyl ester carboxylesterase
MAARLNPPRTRYAQVGDADVAYKVAGSGPFDLIYFSGLGAHVDLSWDHRVSQDFYSSLASFSRLLTFDRRGTGASDGVARSAIPTWEEWTEDVRAVLDVVGSDRAAVVAQIDAGPIAILFAAMHPERVSALVLLGTTARYVVADDYPIGISPESVASLVENFARWWGTPELIRALPGVSDDADAIEYLAMQARAAATPRTAAAQYQYLFTSLDVRQALPLIQAPTLVVHSKENRLFPIEHGRYVADHIPGARMTEITGAGDMVIPADASGP